MIHELVLKSRTIRSFDESKPVGEERLKALIDTARLSPSARNMQALKYKLIYDKEGLDTMMSLTRWGGATPGLFLPPKGHYPTAFIVICNDAECTPEYVRWLTFDAGLATEAIILRANEMGLGGCVLGAISPDNIKKALKLDERYNPIIVIGLGTPDEEAKVVDMKDGKVDYYRDENNVNCVPKRSLEEVLI